MYSALETVTTLRSISQWLQAENLIQAAALTAAALTAAEEAAAEFEQWAAEQDATWATTHPHEDAAWATARELNSAPELLESIPW